MPITAIVTGGAGFIASHVADALIAPPDPGTPFGRRYLAMLQVSPGVVMAHSAVVQALGPRPAR